MILIISGPPGVGKGTIISALLPKHTDFVVPSSYTTRPPRIREGTKKKYLFVSEEKFRKLVKQKKILESVFEHLWWYGTDRESFEKAHQAGKNILMELEPRGALNIKKLYPEARLIFLMPDSIEDLLDRIHHDFRRANITKQELRARLKSAKRELKYAPQFDYQIKNPHGYPEQAIKKIEKILIGLTKKSSIQDNKINIKIKPKGN